MTYAVEYEVNPDHLYARITGPETYEGAVAFWEELARKVREEGHERILVLDEVTGRLSVLKLHKVSEIVSSLFRGCRMAYIDPKNETFEDNKFGETVVRNRSGGVRLFRDLEEGLGWLLGSD